MGRPCLPDSCALVIGSASQANPAEREVPPINLLVKFRAQDLIRFRNTKPMHVGCSMIRFRYKMRKPFAVEHFQYIWHCSEE